MVPIYKAWHKTQKKMYTVNRPIDPIGLLDESNNEVISVPVSEVEVRPWSGYLNRKGEFLYRGDIVKEENGVYLGGEEGFVVEQPSFLIDGDEDKGLFFKRLIRDGIVTKVREVLRAPHLV